MASTRFARRLAAPILSAGIFGGAALGMAGMAHADYEGSATPTGGYSTSVSSSKSGSADSFDTLSNSANFFGPATYAAPATTWMPWASTLMNGYSN